jgi:hypothetical protein
LLLDGLRAGYKHLSTADPALHYHVQEACRESTPDAVSVGQTITNFSQGYAKAALDNVEDPDHPPKQETLHQAFRAEIASPLDTSRKGRGDSGEPNRGPRRELNKAHTGYGKKTSEYHDLSKDELIRMILAERSSVKSLKNELVMVRARKDELKEQLQTAKSIAISKVGSVHKVETAMLAEKPPRWAKVSKPAKHIRTILQSDDDSSALEFAGVAFEIESLESEDQKFFECSCSAVQRSAPRSNARYHFQDNASSCKTTSTKKEKCSQHQQNQRWQEHPFI